MGVDVLTQALETICFDEAVAAVCEFGAPWSVTPRDERIAAIYATLEGCWLLDVPPELSIPIREGDVVLLPSDRLHHARDGEATARSLERPACDGRVDVEWSGPTAKIRYGGCGRRTRILTATIPAHVSRSAPAFSVLPPFVLVRGDGEHPHPAIATTVRRLADEVEDRGPGHMLVAKRLIEVLFVEVLRAYAGKGEAHPRLLDTIGDRRIGAALAVIHRDTHKALNVAELARVAGMSRSLFSERFVALVGVTPHQYLVRVRMQRAAHLLRSQRLTVPEVSARVGYASESSFSRTFTRELGVPPAVYRDGKEAAPVALARASGERLTRSGGGARVEGARKQG